MTIPLSIFWFRRDLRLEDNAGLYHALKGPNPLLPIFIFDRNILDELSDRSDSRLTFIYQALSELRTQLAEMGSTLRVYHGFPAQVWADILQEYKVAQVFTNRDYEPYALQRDAAVEAQLAAQSVPFLRFKDQVIFEKDEVLKSDGTPYTVFTPYSRRWKEKLETRWAQSSSTEADSPKISYFLQSYPTEKYFDNLLKIKDLPSAECPMPTYADLRFSPSQLNFPPKEVARGLIRNYDKTRNIPGIRGTSRLGVHFRFGTLSIREKARHAEPLNATFLNELIWRDFYSQILAHFPQVVTQAFRPVYDRIEWRTSSEDFEKWKNGQTGYPLVDAGMRELNATGFMHNRVRMVVASFFSKHLLLDWRLGEAYFAEKLLDYDLASNSGGWQWAAGSGTDAAPYFRIFNPELQMKKFDPDLQYVRKWVPEYGTPKYVRPMVEHTFARARCLDVYKKGLQD